MEVWRKLVLWFAWARRYDDWQSEFERLPLGDPIRELQHSLLWSFRFFVPLLPESVKVGDWLQKSKMCISAFIGGCLSEMPADELSQQQYLDWCIEWTIEQLKDADGWAEYDRRKEREQFEAQLNRERRRAGYGKQEAIMWLTETDPDFDPADFEKNSSNDGQISTASTGGHSSNQYTAISTDGDSKPQPESEAIGEVPNDAIITAQYVGGKTGFFVQTADGLEKIIRGQRYRLPGHIWENIIEQEQTREWKKL